MTFITINFTNIMNLFHNLPETFVNISQQAIVSYLCLNLAITPVFIACQTQLMLSVFAVLFFFINAALLLIILGLEYLGLAILLVYAGAIIMILLFVIMLVKLQETEDQPFAILAPSRWASTLLPIQEKHTQVRSLFLITVITLGAVLLTYSCRAFILEITPNNSLTGANIIAPSVSLFTLKNLLGTEQGLAEALVLTGKSLKGDTNEALFHTYAHMGEPNYIPWLFTYFNGLLEVKFQPLVLEDPETALWKYLAFFDAPSYNLDKWTLNLVGQLGKLHEILPNYSWVQDRFIVDQIPMTGDPLTNVSQLVNYSDTLKQWEFYPRTRFGVYAFPELPMQELKYNTDIPQIYAQSCELRDQLVFPNKDISNISSVLYTLHAPALVLAAVCLFVAMVLSFLLTDFKVKY